MGAEDVNLLMNAFDRFKKASLTLEGYYRGLERRIEELNIELDENNNYLTSILEGLPVGIIVTGRSLKIETLNSTACMILGRESGELAGRCLNESIDLRGKLGGLHNDNVSGSEVEIAIQRKGKRKKFLAVNSTLLKDINGRDRGYLFVLRDTSEVKRLRESIQRDRRLSAMGEMAASIAHQIRNPLCSIELFASLLNNELSQDGDKKRLSKGIVHAVRSLNNTLSNMLLFANNAKPFKTEISITELIEETVDICKFLIQDRDVRIEAFCQRTVPPLLADKDLLKQSLMNIIMNGVDMLEGVEGGMISVTSSIDAEGIRVSVADNGPGIPEEDLDKVFDPFFTTRPKGTGLGLTVANNIVKAHGGFLGVESETGKGAVFDITLPKGVGDG